MESMDTNGVAVTSAPPTMTFIVFGALPFRVLTLLYPLLQLVFVLELVNERLLRLLPLSWCQELELVFAKCAAVRAFTPRLTCPRDFPLCTSAKLAPDVG